MNDMASIRKIRPLSKPACACATLRADEGPGEGMVASTFASEDCFRGDN
jgi:hypothetical protein